jgi:hypothetical protein
MFFPSLFSSSSLRCSQPVSVSVSVSMKNGDSDSDSDPDPDCACCIRSKLECFFFTSPFAVRYSLFFSSSLHPSPFICFYFAVRYSLFAILHFTLHPSFSPPIKKAALFHISSGGPVGYLI